MRKFILAFCAVMAIACVTSCQDGTDAVNGTKTSEAFNDSISEAFGQYYGSIYLKDFSQRETPVDSKQFLKGVRMAFAADTSRLIGLSVGLRMNSELDNAPYFANVVFDKSVVSAQLVEAFNLKKVDDKELAAVTNAVDSLVSIASALTAPDAELGKRISPLYGKLAGLRVALDIKRAAMTIDEAAFENGITTVLDATDDETDFVLGLAAGVQMMNDMTMFSHDFEFVSFDKGIVLNCVAKMIKRTSITPEESMKLQHALDSLTVVVGKINTNRLNKAASETDEAIMGERTGKAFIDNLKKNDPEVKTTSTGLCYKITNPGEGAKPTDQNTVTVHYTGAHIDGTVFDSSIGGEPATFKLHEVIPGFREGIMLLGKGGKATLFIPGNIGYGPQGVPQAGIRPNETLVFEIEIVDIN